MIIEIYKKMCIS